MAGRLLIADSVASNRVVLKVKFAAARYGVTLATDLSETVASVARDHPDLVILEAGLALPNLGKACAELRAASVFQRLPIILTASDSSPVTTAEVLAAGADELVRRPVDETFLMARVRSLLRMRETTEEVVRRRQTAAQLGFSEPQGGFDMAPRLAFVHPDTRRKSCAALPANLPGRTRCMAAADALDLSEGMPGPELIFLSLADRENAEEGLSLLSELRSRPGTRHTALVVLVPACAPRLAAQALDLGANDILRDTAATEEVLQRVRRQIGIKRDSDHLRRTIDDGLRIASMDALTGLHNRRYADYHLERIHAEAAGSGRTYALILADIDRFKAINDRHGHAVGDAVLMAVAERLREALRSTDMLARIGGEEFLAILPETEPRAACAVAFRLAHHVRRAPVTLPNGHEIAVTASFGVAFAPPFDSVTGAMARADKALYRAKGQGRDCVELDAAPPGLSARPPLPQNARAAQGALSGPNPVNRCS